MTADMLLPLKTNLGVSHCILPAIDAKNKTTIQLLLHPASFYTVAAHTLKIHHTSSSCIVTCTQIDILTNLLYRPLKVYLINMAMGWVQQKKEIELDPKYKLPKMRYKGNNGNVTPQTMRMDAKPLVTEMRDVPEAPQFPLLTKKRPITVPGAPKAYKEPLKASTDPPQAPTAKTPTSTKAFSSNKPAQAKQASSSAILKEAATQPPQAQPVATTLMNGAPVPSGILVIQINCSICKTGSHTSQYLVWLLTCQGSRMCIQHEISTQPVQSVRI